MSAFAELRRRHVFKIAAAYGVVAWLIVEAASIALPAFGAPDWVLRAVIILAGLGLPVALVLAWAYEITPDGVRRDASLEALEALEALAQPPPEATEAADPRRRRMDPRAAGYLGVGIIAALVSVGAVSQFGVLPGSSREAPARRLTRERRPWRS